MKKNIILLLLFSSFMLNAQDEKTDVAYFKNVEAKITSLKYTSNSISELKSINWEDVKSIFDSNNPEENIELSFEIDFKKSKNKLKSSFKVAGKTKNIDSIITMVKKGLNGLIKMSNNHEKN